MKKHKSLGMVINSQCERFSSKPALKVKKNGYYRDITWYDLKQNVRATSYFLNKSNLKKEDKVAIISENRPEWVYVDAGALSVGVIDVPIYPTNSALQVQFSLKHADVKIVFLSDHIQLEKVLAVWDNCPALEKVVCFNKDAIKATNVDTKYKNQIFNFEDVILSDENIEESKKWDTEFVNILNSVNKDDIATIIYTSGTTGEPKGVMLTHYNFISDVDQLLYTHPHINENDQFLSFLPLSHVFERVAGYYAPVFAGACIAYVEKMETIVENLKEIRPTVISAVPRIFEKMHSKILDNVYRGSSIKRSLFAWATITGRKVSRRKMSGKDVEMPLMVQHMVATQLVYKKIQETFGGRLRVAYAGGAPLSRKIQEFFVAAGVIILEGYGLTETSPVIAVNKLDKFKNGTVGFVLPEIEAKLAEDGELLVRGPNVMKGYYKNEEKTKEVLSADGWFATGDICSFDSEGFLSIKDRKKEMIITSGGKNVYPAPIENLLTATTFIEQVCLIGDKRKYMTALIVPKFSAIQTYAENHGIEYLGVEELVDHPKIIDLINHSVEEVNKNLSQVEKIKRFKLLKAEFKLEEDELTPTLKLKRRVIFERYKDKIEEMYS